MLCSKLGTPIFSRVYHIRRFRIQNSRASALRWYCTPCLSHMVSDVMAKILCQIFIVRRTIHFLLHLLHGFSSSVLYKIAALPLAFLSARIIVTNVPAIMMRPWAPGARQAEETNVNTASESSCGAHITPLIYNCFAPLSIPCLRDAGIPCRCWVIASVISLCFGRCSNYHPVPGRSRKHPVCVMPDTLLNH
jgi:hypothetical protein